MSMRSTLIGVGDWSPFVPGGGAKTKPAIWHGSGAPVVGAQAAAPNRTRVHCNGSCGAGVWTPYKHPKKNVWVVWVCPLLVLTVTLNRGAPAPQWPPFR